MSSLLCTALFWLHTTNIGKYFPASTPWEKKKKKHTLQSKYAKFFSTCCTLQSFLYLYQSEHHLVNCCRYTCLVVHIPAAASETFLPQGDLRTFLSGKALSIYQGKIKNIFAIHAHFPMFYPFKGSARTQTPVDLPETHSLISCCWMTPHGFFGMQHQTH